MVWTFKLTDGGLTFTDGSLDMVGTKDDEDHDEVLQRTLIRLKTGLTEDNWHPEQGFDFEGLQLQIPPNEEMTYSKEELISLNIRKCLAQDNAISEALDRLEVVKDNENARNFIVHLLFHTLSEEGIIYEVTT